MKITITGSSGYLGKDLKLFFEDKDFEVFQLSRDKENIKEGFWDPNRNLIDEKLIEDSDVIINLNGAKIIEPFRRKRFSTLKSSRLNPSETISNAIKKSKSPPNLIISASACGIYGNRPNEVIDEKSPKGRGKISDLVYQWESIQKLQKTRVVFLRFGTIIDKNSEIYKYMKKFSSIVGISSIGSGENYFPWISKLDAIRAIHHIIKNEELKGPINIVSSNPISFKEVIREINLKIKPIIKLKLPEISLPIIFGKYGKEILLSDQKVLPTKLKHSGFNWMNSNLSGSIN